MSTRLFCDACSTEICHESDNAARDVYCPAEGGVTIRVEAGWNKVRQGDICRKCMAEEMERVAAVIKNQGSRP